MVNLLFPDVEFGLKSIKKTSNDFEQLSSKIDKGQQIRNINSFESAEFIMSQTVVEG
jgi:hypothetical protein